MLDKEVSELQKYIKRLENFASLGDSKSGDRDGLLHEIQIKGAERKISQLEKEVQSAESERAKLKHRYEVEIKALKKHEEELIADIN